MPLVGHRSPETFEHRRNDWRCGHLLYQIFVDRFAPSSRLDSKREHYTAPRLLRPWTEVPERGQYIAEHRISEQECHFWGGDLQSVRDRLDHVQSLGIDVVYLNPIFEAFSNHKYDASDYFTVDPQYGTREDLRALAEDLHRRGMRLMLDGVFNHVGRRNPMFQRALASPAAPERAFFVIGDEHKNGYRGWRNVGNLPELNLENPAVRDYLWNRPDSVV